MLLSGRAVSKPYLSEWQYWLMTCWSYILWSFKVPKHDVLLTNPPYSGDHVEKLLRFCRNLSFFSTSSMSHIEAWPRRYGAEAKTRSPSCCWCPTISAPRISMRTEAAVGPSGFEGFECWKFSLSSWSYQHQKHDVACEATTDLVLSIVNILIVNKKAILRNKRHVKSHRNAALLHIFRKPVFEARHIEMKILGVHSPQEADF